MRADIHDGPEQMLQSKAGYIDARPLTASSAKPLATRGRTIHEGQSRRFDAQPATSGPLRSTDINRPAELVRFAPEADLTGSITSTASKSHRPRLHLEDERSA